MNGEIVAVVRRNKGGYTFEVDSADPQLFRKLTLEVVCPIADVVYAPKKGYGEIAMDFKEFHKVLKSGNYRYNEVEGIFYAIFRDINRVKTELRIRVFIPADDSSTYYKRDILGIRK